MTVAVLASLVWPVAAAPDQPCEVVPMPCTFEGLPFKITVIDAQFADATRTSPAAALIAAGDQIMWNHWQQMSPTQRAQGIDEVAVVTIMPLPKGWGGRGFDPDFVRIQWRRS